MYIIPVFLLVFRNSFRYSSFLSDGGSKHDLITRTIVNMIVTDCLPFKIVEGSGFLQLMRGLAPLYKVPCRNTIKNYIDNMYDEGVIGFKQDVNHLSNFCLTTDIWTDVQNRSMLGITIHGVKGVSLFSNTIGVFELTERHTGEYIAETLLNTLMNFDIDSSKIISVVTDNGANMVKAVEIAFGKDKHIPCFAHTLNLTCQNALSVPIVKDIVTKCRTIVIFCRKHVHVTDKLRKLQAEAGIPEGGMLKLILDVPTRWNSVFYMLQRFLNLFNYIATILLDLLEAPEMITNRQRDELQEIISLLRPMEAMTTQLSGDKYSTLSCVIPLTHCGRKQIESINCKYNSGRALKSKLLDEFRRRFGYVERSHLVASSTTLDPRFKNIHFEESSTESIVNAHLCTILSADSEQGGDMSEPEGEEHGGADGGFDLWAHHKSLVVEGGSRRRRNAVEPNLVKNNELSLYLSTAVSDLKADPLKIWDSMKELYPSLYPVARNYLSLVATSVPSERLFSKAGSIANFKRNRLLTKRLNKLLFLNSRALKL